MLLADRLAREDQVEDGELLELARFSSSRDTTCLPSRSIARAGGSRRWIRCSAGRGELGVRQPPTNLSRITRVARLERRQSVAHEQAALRQLAVEIVIFRRRLVGDVVQQRAGAPPPAQLVKRRVARDREQPRPRRAAPDVKQGPAAKGPLEGERRDVLGRGAVAQQRAT